MYHINAFRPTEPEPISAVFDSVLRRDSTLFPALIHPIELSLMYRDTARFARYFPAFARTARPAKVSALRAGAGLIWGPRPTTNAIGAALAEQKSSVIMAVNSSYRRDGATSDSVLQMFDMVQRAGPRSPVFWRGHSR